MNETFTTSMGEKVILLRYGRINSDEGVRNESLGSGCQAVLLKLYKSAVGKGILLDAHSTAMLMTDAGDYSWNIQQGTDTHWP